MEEKKIEQGLMNEQEFKEYLANNRPIYLYGAVSKFKSVWRAIRRGHVSETGMIYPRRPFNNRANTSKRKHTHSRVLNQRKKAIYGQLIQTRRISEA